VGDNKSLKQFIYLNFDQFW